MVAVKGVTDSRELLVCEMLFSQSSRNDKVESLPVKVSKLAPSISAPKSISEPGGGWIGRTVSGSTAISVKSVRDVGNQVSTSGF